MPNEDVSTSIDKVMESAWNQTMGEALTETPDERHHLGDEPVVEAPSEPAAKPAEPVTEPVQTDSGEEKITAAPDTQQPESVEPPQHWSESDRQTFSKLDEPGRKFLLRRHKEMEADYTRKTQEHSETVKLGKVVGSYLDSGVRVGLSQAGVSEDQFITSLLKFHQLSINDPEEFMRASARNLGIDPAKVFGVEAADPKSADPVERRIAAVEQRFQQEDQQRHQQLASKAATTMQEFASEKDAAGNEVHPHFEAVRHNMGRLMLADPSLDMKTAYEVAVYRDPNLRSSVIQPVLAQAPAATPLDARKVKEAEAAAAAKRSNIRSNATSGLDTAKDATKKISIRDAMAAAADQTGFR